MHPGGSNEEGTIHGDAEIIGMPAPNKARSADFMSDMLYTGKRFQTFNVIDDFSG